jgi:hypothetical protein
VLADFWPRGYVVTWKAGLSESMASNATVRCRLYLANQLADSAMSSSQEIILTGAALFSHPDGGNQYGTLYDRRINVTCNSPTINYPFQAQKVVLTEVASVSAQQIP